MGRFLGVQVADQLLVFLVVENDAAGRVEQGEGDRRRVDDRFDQVLLIAHDALQPVHLGDVAWCMPRVRRLALGIDDRRDGQFGQVERAVLRRLSTLPDHGRCAVSSPHIA